MDRLDSEQVSQRRLLLFQVEFVHRLIESDRTLLFVSYRLSYCRITLLTVNSIYPEMSIYCFRRRYDMLFEVPKSSNLGYESALTYNLLDIFRRSLLLTASICSVGE